MIALPCESLHRNKADAPAEVVVAPITTCERCQMKGHYNKKCIKCSDYHQWGHGSKMSRHYKFADKTETVGTIVEDNSNGFVMSVLAHITSRADIRLASVGNSKGNHSKMQTIQSHQAN